MNRPFHHGFTLLEIMIALLIIAILATIAYPSYQNQVQKTRRVDGKNAVLAIAMAEEQFYTQEKRYTDDLTELSINSTLQGGASDEGHYRLNLQADDDGTRFTITATVTGPQAADEDCETLSMNQVGEREATGESTAQCW